MKATDYVWIVLTCNIKITLLVGSREEKTTKETEKIPENQSIATKWQTVMFNIIHTKRLFII